MNTNTEAGTPRTWFTSDTHFGHVNILNYNAAQRGHFVDTDEMDEYIIRKWNETVAPDDIVYHLGDIALGPIDKTLAKVDRLNGYKIAKLGNHDRPFMRYGKKDEIEWWDAYREVFQDVLDWRAEDIILTRPDGRLECMKISHFPYTGDHTEKDRHVMWRAQDLGTPLIHGHTHKTDRLTRGMSGTKQIHVGMDAWDLTPVSSEAVFELLDRA